MTFTEWLLSLPLERIAIYTIVGLIGMLAHAAKKWMRGQLSASIASYLFVENRAASFMAVGAWLGAVATAIASGALTELGWGTLLTSGFTAGWAIDSGVNKGADAERLAIARARADEFAKEEGRGPARPGDPKDPGAP